MRTQRNTSAERHTERAVEILRSGFGALGGRPARPAPGSTQMPVGHRSPAVLRIDRDGGWQAGAVAARPPGRRPLSAGGPASGRSEASSGPAARVLLAVGDLAQGMMIRRALEADGHEVESVQSGRDTVLALLAGPSDVLLINAPLSDGSAAALLRWTRSRNVSAHMTCMVMVPPGDSRQIATLYDAGADFVITRTTELDLLSRKVAATLARRPFALAS